MTAPEYDALAQQLREACGAAALAFLEATYTDPAERLKQLKRALADVAAQQAGAR